MKTLYFSILLSFIFQILHAQNDNVGIGTNTPDSSARLDIDSPDQGLLIPRMTTSARLAIGSPAPGLLVYDTEKRTIYMFDGQNWLAFAFATSTTGMPPTERTTGSITSSLGYRVAIGSLGIVSSTNDGRVFFFESDGGNYVNIEEIVSTASDPVGDKFGEDIAVDGNFLVVGAPGSTTTEGKVYVFERIANAWVEQQVLSNSTFSTIGNGFGHSVSMSGDKLVVGSPFDDPFSSADEGAFSLFERTLGIYNPRSTVIQPGGSGFSAGDYFGWDVDIRDEHIIVGAPGHNGNEGKAYFFRIISNVPVLDYQNEFSAVSIPNVYYGYSVGIHPNGAIIGYPGLGSNYGGFHIIGNFGGPAFGDEGLEFQQFFIDGASISNRYSGASVDIDASHFIVGTPDKFASFFSTSESNLNPSKAVIYSYELRASDNSLGIQELQTWESSKRSINGMGISTSIFGITACAGHDEENKFFVKDFEEE